ncbi:MAG: hypothetical protein M1829_001399 [Trizodia sp. TS-e1964]|nr:MAG: hypothetical protein M1829_001399 [Trizodia sp. TS-e1964]
MRYPASLPASFPAALLCSLALTVLAAPNPSTYPGRSDQGTTGVPIQGEAGFYALNAASSNRIPPLPIDDMDEWAIKDTYGLTTYYGHGMLELFDTRNTKLGCLGSDGREVLSGSKLGCGRFVIGSVERTKGGSFYKCNLDFWQQYGNRDLPQVPYYCFLDGRENPKIKCDSRELPEQEKLLWDENFQLLVGMWGKGILDNWTPSPREGLGGDAVLHSGGSGKVKIRFAADPNAASGLPAFL